MKWLASSVASFVLVGTVALLARAADAPADRETIQGSWRLVTLQRHGRSEDRNDDNDRRLVLKGDHFQMLKGDEVLIDGTFKLDPAATPKTIDVKVDKANEGSDLSGKTSLGIYELKGDEFKWCAAEPGVEVRPTAFAAEADKVINAVFHREGKDAK